MLASRGTSGTRCACATRRAMPGGGRWLDDFVQDTRFALRTPASQSRVRAHGDRDAGVRHRRQHRHVQPRQRPAAAAAVRTPRRSVGVSSRSTAPEGEIRGISYPNYLDLREGTTDIFANLAAYSTVFVGLDVGEGPRRTLASAVTANYFQIFGRPLALGRPFTAEEERLGADIRVAIISHSALGATRRRPERARPARSDQRRAVHRGRCGSEGIHRDEHPRTRGVAAARRARYVHDCRRVGRAPARRARGARVERRRAAPSWHLDRDRRAGTRHRWPPARAGVSGDQRRLHARDVDAFASSVHARSRKRRDHCDALPCS